MKLSRDDCRVFSEIYLPEILFDYYVISLSALKAHTLARITGTLKNMMEAAPPEYYGVRLVFTSRKYNYKGM